MLGYQKKRGLIKQGLSLLILGCVSCLPSMAEETQLSDDPASLNPSSEDAQNISISFKSNPDKQKIVVITLEGAISKNLLKKVEGAINQIGPLSDDAIPANLIVLLNSGGGDGEVAMQVGRMLRKAHAHVFVTAKCASACTFILAGGVVRGAAPSSIGIHHGRLTITDSDGKILREIDPNVNLSLPKRLNQFELKSRQYLEEMGITPKFFSAMQSYASSEIHWLSEGEITSYNLNGFDPDYLNDRMKFYENQYGAWRLERHELEIRTEKVVTECSEMRNNPQGFIECYKEVLIGLH